MLFAAAVLSVHVIFNNLAGIPAQKVDRYFQDVSAIYSPIKIDAEPLTAGAPETPSAFYIVLSDKSLPPMYDVMGAANVRARVAWVFIPHIRTLGGDQDALRELVIAHELGHLLGLWHTVSGIMAPVENYDSPETNMHHLDRSQIRAILKANHSLLSTQPGRASRDDARPHPEREDSQG